VNRGGKLYSLGYGSPAALQVDPSKKNRLIIFARHSVFSMGTAGCNMGCFFCQNWDISKSRHDQVHSQNIPRRMFRCLLANRLSFARIHL